MPPERCELPTRRQVPDPCRAVPAGRDRPFVGSERDFLKAISVAAELSLPLEGVRVPHGDNPITPDAGQQRSAVGAEPERIRISTDPERALLFSGGGSSRRFGASVRPPFPGAQRQRLRYVLSVRR